MTNVSRSISNPIRGWHRLGLGAALLGLLALPLSAQSKDEEKPQSNATTIRAEDTDKVSVSASNQLQLSLSRAPASAAAAKVLVVNSNNYALWTAPLTRSGANWTAQLDLRAVEALLTGNAIQAEFPGAATGGKDLRISFVRDIYETTLAPTASLVNPNEPLFYVAPKEPTAPDAIGNGADASRTSSYAMASRRYDEQLTAYYHSLVAAKAQAHALWMDLKTAGRLPAWPTALLAAQDKAFAAIDAKAQSVMAVRAKHRETANAVITAWNSSTGEDEKINLTFRAES